MSDAPNWLLALIAALTLVGGLVAWALRLEWRISKAMTRDEHERICEQRNAALHDDLHRMEAKLDERASATQRDRERLFDEITRLGRNLAVLQDRAGLYRFDEGKTS